MVAPPNKQTGWHSDIHASRHTIMQAYMQADSQTGKHRIYIHVGRQKDRQVAIQASRQQTSRQVGRLSWTLQAGRQEGRQTDLLRGRLASRRDKDIVIAYQ